MRTSPMAALDAGTGSVFLASAGGRRLIVVDASDGSVTGSVDVAGLPLAAADGRLVVCDPPSDADAGRLSMLRAAGTQMETLWARPLLDDASRRRLGSGIDEVALDGRIGGDEVEVDGEIRTAYLGGAAPPAEVLDEADRRYRLHLRLASDDGHLIEADLDSLEAGEAGTESAATSADAALADPGTGTWSVTADDGESHTVRLEPGADQVMGAGHQVLYRVVEDAVDGSVRRVYLRSRPLTDEAPPGPAWSTLVEELPLGEPPRPGAPAPGRSGRPPPPPGSAPP